MNEFQAVHELFQRQADRSPQSTAVVIGDDRLTYAELNGQANQLAHLLIRSGISPGDFVGCYMDRSIEMMVSVYAILKAGGVYVPLDPEYPSHRIGYMVEDSKVALVLARPGESPDCQNEVPILSVEPTAYSSQPADNPNLRIEASDLVYMIYTSGSTGQPKGSLVYHGGFANLVEWYATEFAFDTTTCVLHMTSPAFDLTQKNLFAPLIRGGQLCLLNQRFYDAAVIVDHVEKHGVTVINCTPSAFGRLFNFADTHTFQRLSSLRQVFLGGEPIVMRRYADWLKDPCCKAEIINTYGPTECTDVVASFRVDQPLAYLERDIPIGKAIPGVQLHVLDDALNPQAPGVEGQLAIGGICVGAGYFGRPELNAEKFVEGVLADGPVYLTGDRARWLDDGNLEYLGRADNQVKVRGFRIELGEIERVLSGHPAVKEAAVAVYADASGDNKLAAYLVFEEGVQIPPTNEIRAHINQSLPDFMLPTAWVTLDHLPMTPNGKLDRRSLPPAVAKRPDLNVAFVAPADTVEEYLAALWIESLGIDRVGVNDRFFELGGSSLNAVDFVARLGAELGVRIPVTSFFEAPTIRAFGSSLWRDHADSMQRRFPDANMLPVTSAGPGLRESETSTDEPIAIIGMAGRFPGAADVDELWVNLCDGVEAVRFASDDELRAAGVDEEDISDPDYVRAYFSLDDVEFFDAHFFGFSPREVEVMDPQHRVFLEQAWACLDNAGYALSEAYQGQIGVFGGIARDAYSHHYVSQHPRYANSLGEFAVNIGNDKNFPATRVAYKLNLGGPAINVQTACSTSGVALHLACQSLRLRDCDMALVGGARVLVPTRKGYPYVEDGPLSRDGHLRVFDAEGSGMVRGSGCAFLLVKRLSDAVRDRDCIRAVIRSTAINNDGNAKVGFTAPSVEGQSSVIAMALQRAGGDADAVGYVEAHGTSTALGDPIEIRGLTRAFRHFTDSKGYCKIGSIKSNIGHLDAGAAAAGMIKCVFSLERGVLPASLNFRSANPEINFEETPFVVNDKITAWDDPSRRAGISSFGLGGTNFHAVLEQYQGSAPRCSVPDARPWQVITLSAKSTASLRANLAGLPEYLDRYPNARVQDLAYSLNAFRPSFNYRAVIVCPRGGKPKPQTAIFGGVDDTAGHVIWCFPAELSQSVAGAREFLDAEPTLKRQFQAIAKHTLEAIGIDPYVELEDGTADERMGSQLLQFSLMLAIARTLEYWGVPHHRTAGDGLGKFVADCLEGRLEVGAAAARLLEEEEGESIRATAALDGAGPNDALVIFGNVSAMGDESRAAIIIPLGGDAQSLTCGMARLWLAGIKIEWLAYYAGQDVEKVPLPPFRFDRQRYWADLPNSQPCLVTLATNDDPAGTRAAWGKYFAIRQAAASDYLNFPTDDEAFQNRSSLLLANQANFSQAVTGTGWHDGRPVPGLQPVFLFPGGGAQYVQMARGLYERHHKFRQTVEEGLTLYQIQTGVNLKRMWFPPPGEEAAAEKEMLRPSIQLPAILIVEIGLARLWQHWGIQPAALLGHSMGENAAACVAGVLTFADALGLVTYRGQLFEEVTPGGMLSVMANAAVVEKYLNEDIDLATINSVEQCTVSGSQESLRVLESEFEAAGIESQLIPISIAAHSRLLDPILERFGNYLEGIEFSAPQIPFVSNLTGTWITTEEATDPQYWVRHLRSTVRFHDGVRILGEQNHKLFLECGPGRILGSLVRQHSAENHVVGSLRHRDEEVSDVNYLLSSLGQLWTLGTAVDWSAVGQDFPGLVMHLVGQPPQVAGEQVTSMPVLGQVSLPRPVPSIDSAAKSEKKSKREKILTVLLGILAERSGKAAVEIPLDQTFVSLGFDSLFLTGFNLLIMKTLRARLKLRQLVRDTPTLNKLTDYLVPLVDDEVLPADRDESPVSAFDSLSPAGPALTGSVRDAVIGQLQANSALLSALIGSPQPEFQPKVANVPAALKARKIAPAAPDSGHGPFKPIKVTLEGALTSRQQAYLEGFIDRYVALTAKSKAMADEHRPYYADPRTVMGFKSDWKELTYTLVADRSKGSHVWDIDGNEYVDCMGGFGAILFGHAPDFVVKALQDQLNDTLDYGPQSKLAGEAARVFCDLTGMERASFCNTGSEATLAAMRLARTATGKDLIVMFSGAYHGIFDEVLVNVKQVGDERRNVAIAPGIPESANNNILVLDYGEPWSLDVIRERAGEIAAVIVEPIQSRHPELQPTEFVRELRSLTAESDIALIFDEIITGFRLHPRGAQYWYGVQPDLASYGKVIGGGMPVGVIAGKSKYMDALDGGPWRFGDDSFPEVGVTYFAGTFIRHPLAIAAVHAVLQHLTESGEELQLELNRRTGVLAERINRAYRQRAIPIRLVSFASAFLVRFGGDSAIESLFGHHLRHFGAHHIWGNRPAFMTTAHSDADFERLLEAFVLAAEGLQEGGFLPRMEDQSAEFHKFTALQSEMWLAIQQGDEASAAYNEQVVFEIDRRLDPEILALALDKTINRHQSLRSVIAHDGDGMSVQPYMPAEFVVEDLSLVPPEERVGTVRIRAQRNVDQPFDFFAGPLMRTLLVQTGENTSTLCVCVSHLVADGYSLEKIMEDIAGFYSSIAASRFIERPAEPAMSEFVGCLADRAQTNEYAEARAYWLSKYRDLPPVLDLPADFPRPAVRTFHGERQYFYLDDDLVEPIRQLAQREEVTPFVLMLTAYQLLISYLTGETDLVVGIPAAGQVNLGMTDMVAHCVSFLPLRSKLELDQPFSHTLRMIRDDFLDAKESQDFAYGDLLQELPLCRDAGRIPLVSTSFNMDQAYNPIIFCGERARFVATPRGRVKYDLLFNLTDEGNRVLLEVDHYADLFTAERVKHWVEIYRELLERIAANPNARLHDLLRLTAEDVAWLDSVNETTYDYGVDSPLLHELVNQGIAIDPHKTAIVFGDCTLSFSELASRSNRLANLLVDKGVGPDDCVLVHMERSIEMVITLVAILKAGGAYLPMEVGAPDARLQYILTESRAKAVVCDDANIDWHTPGVEVITWGMDAFSTYPSTPPETKTLPEHLAYVIYTSGSTGHPKGVMVTHRAICNRLLWHVSTFPPSSDERVLQKTPYTFDVSVWEFFYSMMTGTTLVIAAPKAHKDPSELVDVIAANMVTMVHFVPSMLQAFLNEVSARRCLSLRRVVTSGEALTVALQNRFYSQFPNVELHNLYGPTEAAVDVTHWVCCPASTAVPIGKPIANTTVFVLDASCNRIPPGQTGELYLGGTQLARGYLNRPDLTAERFIDNPFGQGRLYRTGDLVRFLPDGSLEYLGRNDFQVKIRGQRIELGEIEAVVESFPGVDQCIVVVREERELDQRLIAYTTGTIGLDLAALRTYVAGRLPQYMIPQHFVRLAEMPRTSSGKVDRNKFPAPTHDVLDQQGATATTDVEKALTDAWEELLGVPVKSMNVDFFAAGGHSLLGTAMLARINKQLGVRLRLQELFQAPTIRQLAVVIESQTQRDELTEIGATNASGPAPATSQQVRLWYLQQINPAENAFNLPTAFRLRGSLNRSAMESALRTVVSRHEILRSILVMEDHQLLLMSADEIPGQVLVDKQTHEFEMLKQQLVADAARAFSLDEAPLFYMHLYPLTDGDWLLYINCHHVVFDGWSYDLFVRELCTLYNAFNKKQPNPLPALPIQYRDYARWHQGWLKSDVVSSHLEYWKDRLGGKLPLLELPADRPRPPHQPSDVGSLYFSLTEDEVQRLEAFANEQGCTLFMLLLGSFGVMLHRYSLQEDIIIGSPISGRNRQETHELMGFFVNTLAYRFDFATDMPLAEFIDRVRQTCIDAYAHQEVMYESLIQHLRLERDRSRSPVFQAFMIYQDTRNRVQQLDGLSKEQVIIDRSGVQTDLDLWMKRELGGLVGGFDYPRELFSTATAKLMSDWYVEFVRTMPECAGARISDLRQANHREHRLVSEWNDTPLSFDEILLPQIVAQHAESRPHTTAVISDGVSLSYAELDMRSNQLAHRLMERGASTGSHVGVCLQRTPDMLVGLLAVMKTGAAYVPLDPEYPLNRLRYMIESSSAGLLLTESAYQDLWSGTGTDLLLLDDPPTARRILDAPIASPEIAASPENLAYVIFTSGSTGKPKGVEIPHRCLNNFLTSMALTPGLSSTDRLLAVTTLSFDIAALELFLPLFTGGVVVMANDRERVDGQLLASLIDEHEITVMQATPGTWRLLLACPSNCLSGMRALVGGETLPRDLAESLTETCDEVWNMYGPTETTIWSTCGRVQPSPGRIDIGRPIANTQCRIVDEQLHERPPLVPGELLISGHGVGDGYLGAPNLSAKAFLEIEGKTWYRTGDRVRWLADGRLEHLGRLDSQVKLRGFRIELGEIEARLVQYPGMEQVVAMVREDVLGDHRLVAYYTCHGAPATTSELRKFLREHLPDYMIPQFLMQLDAFPRTANGKVDLKNLPAPFVASVLPESDRCPQTAVEKLMAELWCDLLGVDEVSADDNFFDLGGHSMLSLQFVSRVMDKTGVEIPPRETILNNLSQLAAFVDRSKPSVDVPSRKKVSRLHRFFGRRD